MPKHIGQNPKSKTLIPELSRQRHLGSVQWLEKKLAKDRNPAKTVIVTHHAPHIKSIPKFFAKEMTSAAYASDLTHLMGKASLWIHGHIHTSLDYQFNGTRIVCNPKGYPDRHGSTDNQNFNPSLVIEI